MDVNGVHEKDREINFAKSLQQLHFVIPSAGGIQASFKYPESILAKKGYVSC